MAVAFAGAAVDAVVELVAIFLAQQWAAHSPLDPFFTHLYAVWEQLLILITSGLSNLLYALAGFALTWAAWRTAAFPRWLAGWGTGGLAAGIGFVGRCLCQSTGRSLSHLSPAFWPLSTLDFAPGLPLVGSHS